MKEKPWWFTEEGHDEENRIFLRVWKTVAEAFHISEYKNAPFIAEQVYMEYFNGIIP
jgi:hypothetical protein